MTKQDILDFVNKVNYAYTYGCQNFISQLSKKIDLYVAQRIQEEMDKIDKKPGMRTFVFNVDEAADQGVFMETVSVSTIQELYMLAVKYGGDGKDWREKEIKDLLIQFTDNEGHDDQRITIYDDYME